MPDNNHLGIPAEQEARIGETWKKRVSELEERELQLREALRAVFNSPGKSAEKRAGKYVETLFVSVDDCNRARAALAQPRIPNRFVELEAIVREFAPAAREILWCALVWNDHNFDQSDLLEKARDAARSLGYADGGIGSGVDRANAWMDRINKALNT
jgi:hypothetical protein